jgi:hypothetical protein
MGIAGKELLPMRGNRMREESTLPEEPAPREKAPSSSNQTIPGRSGNEPPDPPLSRARIFLVFFVLGGALYLQTLGCPFLWDEYSVILGNAKAGAFGWERLPELFLHRYFHLPGSLKNELPLDVEYYRPITVLFHGLTYKAFGPFFPAYHLESLFLHIGSALLLFSLFSTLCQEDKACPKGEAIALAGALLFLVHPRNVETVSIIANQTGLLSTFFCLLSVYLWARLLKGTRHVLLLYGLSLLTLLLAMLSKETGYVVPLVHGLVFLLLGPKNKKNLALLSGYFLLPGIPLAVRQACLGGHSIAAALATQLSRQGSWGNYLASILGLLLHQLHAWLLPLDIQLFQYPFSISQISLPQILLPILLLILFVWSLHRHRALLAFGFGWFLVFYLPSSNLISIGTLPGGSLKAAAHHLYPAHAGLCLLLAATILLPLPGRASLRHALVKNRLRWPVLALVVLLLGFQTARFTGYFRDTDRFYQALLEKYPLSMGAWMNYGWCKLYIDKDPLGSEWILMGGLQAAEEERNRGAKMDFMNNLMVLYLGNDRPVEAETMLQCIMQPWIVHPEGNIYFWHVIQSRERIQKDPGEKSQ